MEDMFDNCGGLINLDLSSFNTKNVTKMRCMFYNCYNLKNIDLSSFNTKNATNMDKMLYNCNNIERLILSIEELKIKHLIDSNKIIYV